MILKMNTPKNIYKIERWLLASGSDIKDETNVNFIILYEDEK